MRWHDPRRFSLLPDPDDPVGEIAWVEVRDVRTPTGDPLRLPADRFVFYAYQARYGSPWGESDLLAAYEPWARKQTIRKMWLTALDRFGTPLPVARVPASYNQADCDRLASQLARANGDTSLVVPADVEVSALLDAGRVEPARAFVAAVEYEDTQIARAILGQELTTQSGNGSGSYALGRVHEGVQDDWIQALRADLAARVLTDQIARPITVAALGPEAVQFAPVVRFPNLTPGEQTARQTLLTALLTGQVIAPGEGWIRSWLGVPAAG